MPPSQAILRPGTVDDAVAMSDYHLRASRESFASLLISGDYEVLEPRLERFRQWLVPESEYPTTVAVIDDTAVGHVTIFGNEIVHVFIDPNHQGRGLGRRLLAAGEEMLANSGHVDIELCTMIGNAPAIALYESAGWTVTDRIVHNDHDGLVYDEHVLVKQLDAH